MRSAARRTLAQQYQVLQSEAAGQRLGVRPNWFATVSAAVAEPTFRAAFVRPRCGPFRLTLPSLSSKVVEPRSHVEEATSSKDPSTMEESRKRGRDEERSSAAKWCCYTRQKLEKYHQKLSQGSSFDSFFFRNAQCGDTLKKFKPRTDLLPDHVLCTKCGCTIDEHPDALRVPTTYEEALDRSKDGGTVDAPPTHTYTLIGRRAFAERIHDFIATGKPPCTMQDSFSFALLNASGVGKTFATITARRALMELAKRKGLVALDYEPVAVYLGLNLGFQLLDKEGAFMSNQGDESSREGAVRSVILQRLNFTLHFTLEAIKAKGSIAAALDSEDPSNWCQRLAQTKYWNEYEFSADIANRNDDSLLVKLCNGIREFARKKLVILTVLDELQYLDDDIKLDSGARLALRVLRGLQVSVYQQTEGLVLLLPIATGLRAKVPFGADDKTFGTNAILGSMADEALMKREDFVTLAHTCLKDCVAAENIPVFAHALYPHVRALTRVARDGKLDRYSSFWMRRVNAQKLVVAAFLGHAIELSSFPDAFIGHVRVSSTGEPASIPVLSFLIWESLYSSLEDNRFPWTWPMPFQEIREEKVSTQRPLLTDFETGCFDVLAYFLMVFGPLLKRIRNHNNAVTKWLRSGSDTLESFPKVIVKRLANSQEQCNPSTSPSLDEMASRDLAADFVILVEGALEICARGMACAVWVHCGGKAPLDFLLLVLRPDKTAPKRVEVQLRFADAKHTTHPQLQNKATLFAEMHSKAKHLREVLAKKLPDIDRTKEFDFSKEKYSDDHLMLCRNQPDADFFSPSTFTWSPWTQLLFCRQEAGAGTPQDATSTSAGQVGKQADQCPVEKEQDH